MGLNKPIIISTSAVDTSNLATKSDMTTLQNSVTSALSNVGGAIKSVQRGHASNNQNGYQDVTISAVDLNKAFVNIQPCMSVDKPPVGALGDYSTIGFLTSGTKLRIVQESNYGNGGYIIWEVIEFK